MVSPVQKVNEELKETEVYLETPEMVFLEVLEYQVYLEIRVFLEILELLGQ